VKSSFNRNAGRVTELVAKPMLSIFFPELLQFQQPLSGMIASKKSLLQKLDFREDYGVDIGLLIDMHLMHANIQEVDIGYIENKSKPWQALGKMSKEVAQTIILKASSSNSPHYNFEEFGVLNEIRSQMDFALASQQESLSKLIVFDMDNTIQQESLSKLIVFDMDNTILRGRFIDTCADKFNFKAQLMDIRSSETDSTILTKRIAKLLKNDELIDVADSIDIVADTEKIIDNLKIRGYVVGIISDSYDCISKIN